MRVDRAIGIDGCPSGWFFVLLEGAKAEFGIIEHIAELSAWALPDDRVLIDIPIGLPDEARPRRSCESEARARLGPRRNSVFPVPSREAVGCLDYVSASRANQRSLGKKLSKQSWAITDKIREVDEFMRRKDRPFILREMHPELCFWSLNSGSPMTFAKKDGLGCIERIRVLERYFEQAHEFVVQARQANPSSKALATDDIIDALVGAVSGRWAAELSSLPAKPEHDAEGLPMEMVFAAV